MLDPLTDAAIIALLRARLRALRAEAAGPQQPAHVIRSLDAGDHTLGASFATQGNFAASAATGRLNVEPAATTTSISAPAISRTAVARVTVTVGSASGTPTGAVTLSVDGGLIVRQVLVNGSATFTLSTPEVGDHTLTATYEGQRNFAGSTAIGNLSVNLQ